MRFFLFLAMFFLLFQSYAQTLYCSDPSMLKLFRTYTPPMDTKFRLKKSSSSEISAEIAKGTSLIAVTDKIPEKTEGYRVTPLAVRGELLAVHPQNPLRELSLQDAQALVRGKIADWQEISRYHGRIHVYFVEGKRALPAIFHTDDHDHGEEKKESPALPRVRKALPVPTISDGKSYTLLAMDPAGVALFSLKRLDEERVPLLKINGIAPSYETVRSLKYPLMKIYYLIAPDKSSSEEACLLEFIRGPNFGAELYSENFLPLNLPCGK